VASASSSRAATTWIALRGEAGARATLENGRDLALLVLAREGDDYAALAARYLAPGRPLTGLMEANPGRARIAGGSWYRVPVALLSPSWLEKDPRAAFRRRPGRERWVHRPDASSSTPTEKARGIWPW
jgi:hypothetical protein